MDPKTRAALEKAGFRFGDYGDFLGLTEAERRLVELRGTVYAAIGDLRRRSGLSQAELAKRLGSSQSRVAKIEAGEPGVSLDLMFKAYLALGGRLADLVGPAEVAEPKRIARRSATTGKPKRAAAKR